MIPQIFIKWQKKLTYLSRNYFPYRLLTTKHWRPGEQPASKKGAQSEKLPSSPKSSSLVRRIAMGRSEKSFNLKFKTNVLGIWQQRQLLIGGWKKFFHCFRSSPHSFNIHRMKKKSFFVAFLWWNFFFSKSSVLCFMISFLPPFHSLGAFSSCDTTLSMFLRREEIVKRFKFQITHQKCHILFVIGEMRKHSENPKEVEMIEFILSNVFWWHFSTLHSDTSWLSLSIFVIRIFLISDISMTSNDKMSGAKRRYPMRREIRW